MKIAVIFDNFGPYHVARLNAAADVAEIVGLEFAAASHEYAWNSPASAVRFDRATIFAEGSSRACSTRTLRGELARILADRRPDAVAIPGWSGRLAFAALAWCLAERVPAILMSESTAADGQRASWKEAIKRRCVAACGAALVGGRRHCEYLVDLGMAAERIFAGYDAVDNAHFATGARAARVDAVARRAELKLPVNYFLASARFIEKKNLPTVLRAYAEFRRASIQAEPWDFVLLGDGPLRAPLERLSEQLGVKSHIHFRGFQQYDALPNFYGLAAAFIHGSLVEQWGLVVNEAMASRLPILASTRCGCAPDLLREGGNGFGFDPGDQGQIASCLLKMARLEAADRAAMADCSAAIIADFGPSRFATGLIKAAETALGVGPAVQTLSVSLMLRTLLSSAS